MNKARAMLYAICQAESFTLVLNTIITGRLYMPDAHTSRSSKAASMILPSNEPSLAPNRRRTVPVMSI